MIILYCYDLLGIDLKAVWGVSSGEARQAFARGESQVNHDSISTWERDLLPMREEGVLVPLFTMGHRDAAGEIGRDPALPDIPSCPELYELVNGHPLSGLQREVYEAIEDVRLSDDKTPDLPAY